MGSDLLTRRRMVLGVAALPFAPSVAMASGTDVAVPIDYQAKLATKVAEFDRALKERADEVVRTLVLRRHNNARSSQVAKRLAGALSKTSEVGGVPHQVSVRDYDGADRLAGWCTDEALGIVYLSSGFSSDVSRIAAGLDDVSVLTIGTVPSYVPDGIVAGFDLRQGRPRVLVNVDQARRQQVRFQAQLLKLAELYNED